MAPRECVSGGVTGYVNGFVGPNMCNNFDPVMRDWRKQFIRITRLRRPDSFVPRFIVVVILFLGAISSSAFSQIRQDQQTVHGLVRECTDAQAKAKILSRSLVNADGKLTKFDDESLYLRKKNRKYYRILFRDVLEIRCNGRSLSLAPEQTTRPHGVWRDINQVYPGTSILIVSTDGGVVKGFSNSASDSHIIIFDRETKARRDIPRENVAAFFGLLGARGGVKAGAAKGTEGSLPSRGDPILLGAAVGIGAIVGAILKSDGRPILIYSK